MSPTDAAREWESYCAKELRTVKPILKGLGYTLDSTQPHILGERYLMQALTTASGKKLILLGRRRQDGERVVIKVADNSDGIRELERERACRRILKKINFAYQIFHSPEELFFDTRGGYCISIQRFIEQESTFLARPLTEQFVLALSAFKAQEGAHATTYGHERLIKRAFDTMGAEEYLASFAGFRANILRELPNETALHTLLGKASQQLLEGRETIEQYCGFLSHTDFVPHNIRVRDGDIYLLDHSSLRFGNKYEGWARFINFMTLYNPPLAEALSDYVRLNRAPEEVFSLKLMRIYRLGEIMWYYTDALKKCSGNLCLLNQERAYFWSEVLKAILADKPLSPEILEAYRRKRDTLRSEDEKIRQKDLH